MSKKQSNENNAAWPAISSKGAEGGGSSEVRTWTAIVNKNESSGSRPNQSIWSDKKGTEGSKLQTSVWTSVVSGKGEGHESTAWPAIVNKESISQQGKSSWPVASKETNDKRAHGDGIQPTKKNVSGEHNQPISAWPAIREAPSKEGGTNDAKAKGSESAAKSVNWASVSSESTPKGNEKPTWPALKSKTTVTVKPNGNAWTAIASGSKISEEAEIMKGSETQKTGVATKENSEASAPSASAPATTWTAIASKAEDNESGSTAPKNLERNKLAWTAIAGKRAPAPEGNGGTAIATPAKEGTKPGGSVAWTAVASKQPEASESTTTNVTPSGGDVSSGNNGGSSPGSGVEGNWRESSGRPTESRGKYTNKSRTNAQSGNDKNNKINHPHSHQHQHHAFERKGNRAPTEQSSRKVVPSSPSSEEWVTITKARKGAAQEDSSKHEEAKSKGPRVTMEDPDARLYQPKGAVDLSSVVGEYAPLKAWREDPVYPTANELRLELDNAFPVGLFLSLQKAQRPGMKQSYVRQQEMPLFYQDRSYLPLHWGQRKLLLCEVMFLTFATQDLKEEAVLVYAGAAHGNHILFLVKLFPNLHFDCYDPSPFSPQLVAYSQTPNSHVRLFVREQGWFDDNVAAKYLPGGEHSEFHKGRKLLFVSDIRDIKYQQTRRFVGDFMHKAKDEMKMQMDWTRIMKPHLTMLKFKLPYPSEGGPAFEEYLRGDVYFQCWAPIPSSETRLLVYREQLDDEAAVLWNLPYYTGKIDYFNVALRTTDFSTVKLAEVGILGPPRPSPPDFFRATLECKNTSSPSPSSSSSSDSSTSDVVLHASLETADEHATQPGESATLGDVWQGFDLPLLTVDAFIEARVWASYIKDLEKLPVTIDRIREKIVAASTAMTGPHDPATVFKSHLNFQRKTENVSEYGTELDPQFVKDIQAKAHAIGDSPA